MPTLHSAPVQTVARVAALDRYFSANVTTGGVLTCATGDECQASHTGDFYPAQLHHVGRHYDLVRDGEPLRIVVVGQEYGHNNPYVSLPARRGMIANDIGLGRRFKAGGGLKARNPHMKGCTSLLRLIFGLGLGADHEGEFVTIDAERVHVFECFALVNFLLCSAVPPSGDSRTLSMRVGGSPGRSTKIMRSNCTRHFRAAWDALEPTLVVAQGYGVRDWIAPIFDLPKQRPPAGVEQLQQATLVSFTHPSTPNATQNWGRNERTPYLLNVVAPTIARACARK